MKHRSSVLVMSDNSIGITQKEALAMHLPMVPMPILFDGKAYVEGRNMTQADFYRMLPEAQEFSTSQPAVSDLLRGWELGLEDAQEILYLPMSSSLSGSYATAKMLAKDFDGRVEVVDTKRVSVAHLQAVRDAQHLAKQGLSAARIREILEASTEDHSIYLMVDTFKYLKKGGRISASVAAVGTVLQIKPILAVRPDSIDAFAKVRGLKAARKALIDAVKADTETRFAKAWEEGHAHICMAYSTSEEVARDFLSEVRRAFPFKPVEMIPLSLILACHVGPGALGLACVVDHYDQT